MPLWLQGCIELFLSAFYSYTAVLILLIAVWIAGGFENRDMLDIAALGGAIWQLLHGVPLDLNIPSHGSFAAISGRVSFVPLGLTLIPLALCLRSGRRLARASYEGQFWVPMLSGACTYSLLSAFISFLSTGNSVSSHPLLAALHPLWVVCLGLLAGGWLESRSLARMIGVHAARWVSHFSQYSRWAGSYFWTASKASLVGLLAFVGLGGLLFAGSTFYNWNDVLSLYQSLHAGLVGDAAITFLQLGAIPNFVVWAMSWSSGAGFAFGQDTAVNLQVTQVGAMPSLPILGALPLPVQPWSYLALLAPLIAGILAGWWFFREGENHYDERLSLKISFRWISWPLSTLGLSLLIGLLTGIWTSMLGWAAHGSLGLGRFTDVGPHPLIFGLFSALWVALGVFVGSALAVVFEQDTSVELDRFAGLNPAQERRRQRQQRQDERQRRRQEAKKQQQAGATAKSRPAPQTGGRAKRQTKRQQAAVLDLPQAKPTKKPKAKSQPKARPQRESSSASKAGPKAKSQRTEAAASGADTGSQQLSQGAVIRRPKARRNRQD